MRIATLQSILMCLCLALVATPQASAASDPVKVYILAGQSNMVGYGKTEMGRDPAHPYVSGVSAVEIVGGLGSLRYMVNQNPGTFGHGGTNPLVDAGGNWRVRNDVNVYAYDENFGSPIIETGGHTPGFGRGNWNGPEYGFGQVMGNAMDQDVLIIKIARGGTTLAGDWRSPSAVANRGGTEGAFWGIMNSQVDSVLTNLDTHFPEYAGRSYVIAGFGWHQGWNDGGNAAMVAEYEANMADFIRDVKARYGADLPFVIANSGFHGWDLSGQRLTLLEAQNAMKDFETYPEFKGSVAVVETRGMWRDASQSPSDFNYHWNHNGVTQYEIGAGMGEAMVTLVAVPEPSSLAMVVAAGLLTARRRRRSTKLTA